MSSQLVKDAQALPLAEQIELIEALWESIAKQGYEPPLTPAQATELDRRLEAHRQQPNDVVAWDSMKKEIFDKYSHR